MILLLFKMFFLIYCYSNTLKCSVYRDVLYRDNRCGKLTAICGHYSEIHRVGHGLWLLGPNNNRFMTTLTSNTSTLTSLCLPRLCTSWFLQSASFYNYNCSWVEDTSARLSFCTDRSLKCIEKKNLTQRFKDYTKGDVAIVWLCVKSIHL